MTILIERKHEHFVGEVSGIDCRQVVTKKDRKLLNEALDQFGVLIFRKQAFTDLEQITFSKTFGEIELAKGGNVTKDKDRRLNVQMADVSNLDKNGNLLGRSDRRRMFNLGNRLWHSDSSYRAIPAKCSLLSCRSVASSGGDTEFAFMPAAYDALDEDTKIEIEELVTEHSLLYSRGQLGFTEFDDEERKAFAPVRQRLVRINEFTGRKSIFLSSHIGSIIGWEIPEARDLIRELMEHATSQPFVYRHSWSIGDLVVWDNRQCMHRVRRFDDASEPRDMRRTTIAGASKTVPQLN
tara:strand:- start:311 stop:1195 length:885 start_codon:yes stop_codon:yes gene_type:complete